MNCRPGLAERVYLCAKRATNREYYVSPEIPRSLAEPFYLCPARPTILRQGLAGQATLCARVRRYLASRSGSSVGPLSRSRLKRASTHREPYLPALHHRAWPAQAGRPHWQGPAEWAKLDWK